MSGGSTSTVTITPSGEGKKNARGGSSSSVSIKATSNYPGKIEGRFKKPLITGRLYNEG